jgi:tetratricopeptide (TPR) repeat protein
MNTVRSVHQASAATTARTPAAHERRSISAAPWRTFAAACLLAVANAAAAQTFSVPMSRTVPPAVTMPYDAALAQYRSGDMALALASLEAALAQDARDFRLRFLRAVVLAELGRSDAAIDAFTAMTREFPELPEPYNNLAVLHAAKGELDTAHQALQDALRASPGYALAHENLGDLHLRLAQRAYETARTRDPASRSAPAKLALANELVQRIGSMNTSPPRRP